MHGGEFAEDSHRVFGQDSKLMQIKLGKHTIFFEPGKHKFTDECGNTINSVTKFTGVIDKSPQLIGWAVRLAKDFLRGALRAGEVITDYHIDEAAKQHQIKKKEAADIGTQIHDLVSKWIKKEKFEIPDDEKVQNGFNAFLEFQRQHKIKWLASEEMVGYLQGSDILFAGIVDAIAEIDGKTVLVDFKSSKGIYPEMFFQCVAYQIAWEQMNKKKIAYRLIVKFGKEDGQFEFMELHDNDKDKKAFLACVELKNRLIELDKKWQKKHSNRHQKNNERYRKILLYICGSRN